MVAWLECVNMVSGWNGAIIFLSSNGEMVKPLYVVIVI